MIPSRLDIHWLQIYYVVFKLCGLCFDLENVITSLYSCRKNLYIGTCGVVGHFAPTNTGMKSSRTAMFRRSKARVKEHSINAFW